jgi:hypothetical protein
VGTEDLKDEHLLVVTSGIGRYIVAAIDFGYSMGWSREDGGEVIAPNGPPALIASIDPSQIEKIVVAIESCTEEEIGGIVDALPDRVMSPDDRRKILKGLLGRQRNVRAALRSRGWLP